MEYFKEVSEGEKREEQTDEIGHNGFLFTAPIIYVHIELLILISVLLSFLLLLTDFPNNNIMFTISITFLCLQRT